ncbi:AbrB family transcriptional regulator [Bacillus sp. EB01]|uniref:AbrB family transcriptional regulator n=1 Tax=Bacillus sp. EB01 TaxID=1347086 RepID=UPI0018CC69D9|nr:AbrB family transcriptional regulator [Bacillus sp. EB01]
MKRHFRILKTILFTLMLALLGGIVFSSGGLPVPWLLGPMAATLTGSMLGLHLYWPSKLRDTALIILGYTLGLSFTGEAVGQISSHFLSIMLMTILLIGYCSLMAVIVSKLSGVDYQTVLLGSIPGGLSQMITLSEEIKETDSSVVTIFQVTRLLLIIFIVPFIAVKSAPSFNGGPNISESLAADMFPWIFVFGPLAVLFAFLGKKVKLPTAFLTGPLLITAALTATGIEGPALPGFVLDLSQFLIGAHLGLMFKKESFAAQGVRLAWALVSGVLLLAGATALAFLLKAAYRMDFITSYLSMAPGGMDQMSIIGHETGADLSIIAGYQLFRLFFIFFALPYLIKGLFSFLGKKKLS